jgi:MHS family proline/betaine transporter-like MFS transporter
MAVPTFLMGLLPGYETLGLLAPVALVLLRAIQGLIGLMTTGLVLLAATRPTSSTVKTVI